MCHIRVCSWYRELHLLQNILSLQVNSYTVCRMEMLGFFQFFGFMSLSLVLLSEISVASHFIGRIYPGFQAAQINWIDNNGMFLFSNNSNFAFGFSSTKNPSLFLLNVVYVGSSRIVWTANRGSAVGIYDKFVFNKTGNVHLETQEGIIWEALTAGKGVYAMELQDSGNLVLLGNDSNDSKPVWQSFSYPTDTLLSNQVFMEGMRLASDPNPNNLTFYLEMKWGDMILYAGYQTRQTYWSMANEVRKIINKNTGVVALASLTSNSWKFFTQNQTLVWQFILRDNLDPNTTWAAVLGSDGIISFYNLQKELSAVTGIPEYRCSTPEPCDPYNICYADNSCKCLPVLSSQQDCKPGITSPCDGSRSSVELVNSGDAFNYFALGFVPPTFKSTLGHCQEVCLGNCSCMVLFFENNSGNCFLFNQIGSLQQRNKQGSSEFVSYIKISSGEESRGQNTQNHWVLVSLVAATTSLVVVGLLCLGLWCSQKKKRLLGSPQNFSREGNFSSKYASEEDDLFENMSWWLVRFSYKDLQTATNNFSVKLGQGGFGSVYKGVLPDGTAIAVKMLEGIGQGKKEFQSEVTTIGRIHHIHLVRLKGFCTEGSHRLLVYEYMAKGSLDRCFKNNGEGLVLDWETRFNIALGTAKGLAYLHDGCSVKIVHCDIKPENVLLDDNYQAKVSDFGLAKLMTREQSRVVTTIRGTRGYLAPEWVTDYAISEKSDVYSFGMVLLEIIGGRRNFDPEENSEKAYFPSFALKMMEEGKPEKIVDSKLKIEEDDERVYTAIKVALWCIQGNMSQRPSMAKVVQMLEGSCVVPQPPSYSQMGSHFFDNFVRPVKKLGTFSESPCCHIDASLSSTQLSGPR